MRARRRLEERRENVIKAISSDPAYESSVRLPGDLPSSGIDSHEGEKSPLNHLLDERDKENATATRSDSAVDLDSPGELTTG